MKILVTGSHGLVGSALVGVLERAANTVVRLVHSPPRAGEGRWWQDGSLDTEAVQGADAVVHLAGESIAGRWTPAKKVRILNSRVRGTRGLVNALSRLSPRPRVFVCASAVGYYGSRGDEVLTESSAPGTDFLAEVAAQWEAAAESAADAGMRAVELRMGLVLSPEGGGLAQMLTPFRLGLGGRIGSGSQYWSWISIADLVDVILHAIATESLRGPVNTVAPNPATNAEFTRTLAAVLRRPALFPVPEFAVRAIFGEMGTALLLASQRVSSAKLAASGYRFRHPELKGALEDLLRG